MMPKSNVIWIKGYSSSGKTSVAHELKKIMLQNDKKVIHLDGDDLRVIFSKKWGYSRSEREELGIVYLKLCNHLNSQGFNVIMSAIAMFSNTQNWAKEHITNLTEVYLEVPLETRKERDLATNKNVYLGIQSKDDQYDIPTSDLTIKNFDHLTPFDTATMIYKYCYEE